MRVVKGRMGGHHPRPAGSSRRLRKQSARAPKNLAAGGQMAGSDVGKRDVSGPGANALGPGVNEQLHPLWRPGGSGLSYAVRDSLRPGSPAVFRDTSGFGAAGLLVSPPFRLGWKRRPRQSRTGSSAPPVARTGCSRVDDVSRETGSSGLAVFAEGAELRRAVSIPGGDVFVGVAPGV